MFANAKYVMFDTLWHLSRSSLETGISLFLPECLATFQSVVQN